MSNARPIMTATAPPYVLEAYYEPETGDLRVVARHQTKAHLRTERRIRTMHEPVSGLDAEDMDAAKALGEDRARELEGRLTEQTFQTLDVATLLAGIGLAQNVSIQQLKAIASHLFGAPIYTHELGHEPTCDAIRAEGYRQFPAMPTRADVLADIATATAKALAAYGETVEVAEGTHGRREHPADTLRAMVPDKPIIVVKRE
jgi:hypothetical protein